MLKHQGSTKDYHLARYQYILSNNIISLLCNTCKDITIKVTTCTLNLNNVFNFFHYSIFYMLGLAVSFTA